MELDIVIFWFIHSIKPVQSSFSEKSEQSLQALWPNTLTLIKQAKAVNRSLMVRILDSQFTSKYGGSFGGSFLIVKNDNHLFPFSPYQHFIHRVIKV